MKRLLEVTLLLGRPPTSNRARAAHWNENQKSTKEWRTAAGWHWREAAWDNRRGRLLRIREPVTIVAVPYHKDLRTPQDTGACWPAVKAAVDGLVDAGIVVDDSGEHVAEIRMLAPVRNAGVDGLMIQVCSHAGAEGSGGAGDESEGEVQSAVAPPAATPRFDSPGGAW